MLSIQALSTQVPGVLVAPLSWDEFIELHWDAERPFVSQPNPELVQRVLSIEALSSVQALLDSGDLEVHLFGPDAFRGSVRGETALEFLARGYNLYIPLVGRHVPACQALLLDVAAELGLEPWQVEIEAFAGSRGGVSSRHYDHHVNFQLLLSGEKEWLVEPNQHIVNPLLGYHPTPDARGTWRGLFEEAYAVSERMPVQAAGERRERLHAGTGTVLFLPRGYWHEVRSLTPTWSVNLAIRGVSWAESLLAALGDVLYALRAARVSRLPRWHPTSRGPPASRQASERPARL
jgi:ribosomal protein L16 Arg81 hydroxylase